MNLKTRTKINIKKEEIKNILILNLGGMGDILLSTPALRALKSSFPLAKIYLMIVPRVFEAVNELPYIDKIFIFHKGAKIFFNELKTLINLRKKRFDLAINMRTLVSKMSAQKMKLLLDIINPKIKAGRDTEGRGYFFDIKIPETDDGEKYEMEYDIDTVKALGIDVKDRSIDFQISNDSIKKINVLLGKKEIGESDILIGVHPGGKPSHRWPIENFSKAIDTISGRISCKFVITSAPDEASLLKKLKEITNTKIISLGEDLNIKELAAFIKRCNLYISNDTAPMHFAAILKTPLIALFGPGYITRFDPRTISEEAVVFYKKKDCAPCTRIKCNSMVCFKEIFPEEVVDTALRLLKADRN